MSERNMIVWLEDDFYSVLHHIQVFEDGGFIVRYRKSCASAMKLVREHCDEIVAIITDIMFPGEGLKAGYEFARKIRKTYPDIHLFCYSGTTDPDVIEWFTKQASGCTLKTIEDPHPLLRAVKRKVSPESERRKYLKSFIVHGHDRSAKSELEDYLQNTMGLPKPITLYRQPSHGETIIEKLEEQAKDVDAVFVLLTPDDGPLAGENVIFELGFFYGMFKRRSGRVFLFYKQPVKLPSDLSGVVYIDITNGIKEAGRVIERELSYLL